MQRRWLEPLVLSLLSATAFALLLFVWIAEEVTEGDTHEIDTAIIYALHPQAADGGEGPRWLWDLARDLTSLGGVAVLTLVVLASVIYLAMARRPRTALFVAAATSLGYGMSHLLKALFSRDRPDLITHDLHLVTASFPSGHAMMSTTVYLTLGAVLARVAPVPRLKALVLGISILLSVIVGLTRIYLGAHWPSDVLAGWAAGAAWALGAWGVAEALRVGDAAGGHREKGVAVGEDDGR